MPDPTQVNAMFGRIAHRYDVTNRVLSGGIDVIWRKRLVKEVAKTDPTCIADLATGSGDVVFALAKGLPSNTQFKGLDFCQPMLDEADKKLTTFTPSENISFQFGDALALPLEDQSQDAVTISFGFRNLEDRHKGLQEMHRILKPNTGHLFILEFSQPYAWFRPFYFFYLKHILPKIAGRITKDKNAYDYLNCTIQEFPNRKDISKEILAAGFSEVKAIPLTFSSVALHVAKA